MKQKQKLKEKKKKAKARAKSANINNSNDNNSSSETNSNNEKNNLERDDEEELKGPENPNIADPARPVPAASTLSSALDWFPVNDFPPLLCNQCGSSLTLARARDIEIEWQAKVESALEEFGRAGSGSANPQESFAKLSAMANQLATIFHPSHGFLFAITLPIINIQAALGMARERRELIKQIRLRSEQCFPRHFQPLNNYLQAEAASIRAQMNSNAPKKLAIKLHEERRALLARIKEISRISHGEESEEFQVAEKNWREAEKS